MKKLFFIIPKVIACILFFLFFSLKVNAQTQYGCRFGLRIWTDLDINPHPQTPAYYNYSNSSDNGYSNFSGRCPDEGTDACYIYNTNGTLRHTGTLGNIYDCPIDDYLPLILIAIASLGFLQIRKIPIFNSENENIYHHRSLQWRTTPKGCY
ncbi:MAG: hypothetical protein EOO47_09115 [Flavobacterium sp.]|nr:MAG: hypothetical protein EOO47_09115 [Flavobacterium sp.]